MPVSKTDARAGTLGGRLRALRRWFRDRKALKAEAEALAEWPDEDQRERVAEFWAALGRPPRPEDIARYDSSGDRSTSREASTAGRLEMAKAIGLADRAGLVAHTRAKVSG